MFLCSKNHYCENDYTAKCNLHIQCYPIKLPMALFTELEPKSSGSLTPDYTTSHQKSNHSLQNSMALAQKQKYKSM